MLGSIADIRTGPFGSTLHAEDYVFEGTPIITTEHFKSGRLPNEKTDIPQVSDEDLRRLQNYILKPDDIVFSRVGSVDINALVTDAQAGWLFSGRVLRVRTSRNIYSQYLHYELSTPRVKNDVLMRAVGQTMPSINTEILKDTIVCLPDDINEQAAIGVFFRNLDDTIDLKKQQYEQTANIKKAMLEKMFPKKGSNVPEIRFEGFTGAWEECFFEDLAVVRRGLTYSPSNVRDSGVRVLRSSNIDEEYFVLHDDDVFVEPTAVNIEPVHPNDILITSANGSTRLIGKRAIIPHDIGNAVHGGFMLVATAKEPDFVNALMGNGWYRLFLKLNVTGGEGAIGNLRKADLEVQRVLVPKTKKEQITIGNFFRNLDTLITAQNEELEKLQNIKKACLFKMFV